MKAGVEIIEDASSIEPIKLNVASVYDDVSCTVPLSTKNGKEACKTSNDEAEKKLTCLQVR